MQILNTASPNFYNCYLLFSNDIGNLIFQNFRIQCCNNGEIFSLGKQQKEDEAIQYLIWECRVTGREISFVHVWGFFVVVLN